MSRTPIRAGDLISPPAAGARTSTRIGRYLTWLDAEGYGSFASYDALWRWSVDDVDAFWRSLWRYFDLDALTSVTGRQDGPALGLDAMPGAAWFPGRTINYAEVVLRMPGRADDDPIVLAESQTRPPVSYSAAELRDAVARVQQGLIRLGVERGTRVAAYAPNIPETMILMLATAGLGAVFSSCAPEFGSDSVIDRWGQIEPEVLVAVDGYRYGPREVARIDQVRRIRAEVPSIRHVVRLPYLGMADDEPGQNDLDWAELTAETGELTFVAAAFDDPLYVLYSSGTTGLPKPIVHGHGGIALEHLKSLALHLDLGPADRFFWFTTTGWMMWNFLVSGPAVGAAVVLFDGDPGNPDLLELWRLAERTRTTYFGTSATFVQQNLKAGLDPAQGRDLSALRGIGSTGSPLSVDGFGWVANRFGPDVRLGSLAGGTDVCTGFIGSTPLHPVHAGMIACRNLGCAVEAFDPAGRPVLEQVGELVVTRPMPSMPVGFWGDADGSRLRSAYFDTYPGVWRHGDWLEIDREGRCVLTGRSDATLNRGGVRLGTAEFYAVTESLESVQDSLVVHLESGDGEAGRLVLFVVPTTSPATATTASPGEGPGGLRELEAEIRTALGSRLSPRHVPDLVVTVEELPRTLSGKKLEVPVKRILSGVPAAEAVAPGSLANPAALETLLSRFRDVT